MRSSKVLLLPFMAVGLLASGCSNTVIDDLAVQGPSVYLKEAEVRKNTENYAGVRASFFYRAGFDPEALPPIGDKRWYSFIRHGWKHVDVECQLFLKALRNAEKSRELINNQLDTTADSVRNILNTLRKSQKTLNLVAESLGLLTETVDNLHESLLLRLPSSVVINDVQKRQLTEREKVRAQVNRSDQHYLSEIGAFEAIGEYLKLCLVHQIEARIPNNLSLTDYVALPDGRVVPVGMLAAANQIRNANDAANVKHANEQRQAIFSQFEERTAIKRAREQKAAPRPRPKPKRTIQGGKTRLETGLSIDEGKRIQKQLCVKNPDGIFGPATREAIAFFRVYHELRRGRELNIYTNSGGLVENLTVLEDRSPVYAEISRLADCPEQYNNVFESLVWDEDNNELVNQRSLQFSAKLNNQKLGCALQFAKLARKQYDIVKKRVDDARADGKAPTKEDERLLLRFTTGTAIANIPNSKHWFTKEAPVTDDKLIMKLKSATLLDPDTRTGFEQLAKLSGLPSSRRMTPRLYFLMLKMESQNNQC